MQSCKEKLKNQATHQRKLSSQHTNCTICELRQFFEKQKRKQSSDLYAWDDRTPIQNVAPLLVTLGGVKKNHEIIVFVII